MHLLRTVTLATSFLSLYASAAIILDGALQALEVVAKPALKRGVSASSPSGRIFDIDGKVQLCWHECMVARLPYKQCRS